MSVHRSANFGIGTKILIPVGATFILLTIALAILIGVTSTDNLTELKEDELKRVSNIVARDLTDQLDRTAQFVQNLEQNDRIVRAIAQLSRFGPYYADPNDYLTPGSIATTPHHMDESNQIFALQASLNLIGQLRGSIQTNGIDTLQVYLLSPFELIPQADPVLVLSLNSDSIVSGQFPTKGITHNAQYYRVNRPDFRLPAEDYFDISSVYSEQAAVYYNRLNFIPVANVASHSPVSQQHVLRFDDHVPILQTTIPIEVELPHPDSWDATTVQAALIVVEQHLNMAAITDFQDRLGLDLGFAQGDQLLISSLGNDPLQPLNSSDTTATLGGEAYYFATDLFTVGDQTLQTVVFSPRAEVQRVISALQQQIIIIATIIIGIGSVIVFVSIQYMISRPLHTLTNRAESLQSGNFSSRVQMQRKDELGHLSDAFDTMASQLESLIGSLEVQVDSRTRDLRAALDVIREITTVLELDVLLPEVVKLTARDYQLYAVAILLPDPDNEVLRLSASITEKDQPFSNERAFDIPIASQQSIIAEAARKRIPVVVNDVNTYDGYLLVDELHETRSELAIPMMLGSRLLGVFDVQSRDPDNFGEDEINALQILAKQTGIAVRNAHLFDEQRHAHKQAERANQAKTAFLASVSHELRTPLNLIINFTEFVRHGMKGDVTEAQKETLGEVIDSSEHLLRLINDVLDMSKIESDSLSLYFEDDIDLVPLLHSVEKSAHGLIDGKDIVIICDIDPNLPLIQADSQRILQVLLNVVSNACKFTDHGHITIRATCPDDHHILISIEDTGDGLDTTQAHLVFEAFKQTETGQRTGGGTGLGMPISKVLVQRHGGQIWFEGKIGTGTIFYILLPVAQGTTQQEQTNLIY